MKLEQTITITTSEIYFHIPASDRHHEIATLCGEKTIYKRHNANEHPPTCPDCRAVLQYCKDLDIEPTKPAVMERTRWPGEG